MIAKALNLRNLLAAAFVCCSIDVAHSALARSPEIYFVGGKLYRNYDAAVQKRWASGIPTSIARADRHWPDVLR